jgi:hypothetical protein
MIEYQLKDIDGNTYSLNGDSVTRPFKLTLTQGEDTFEYDNRIVERSFLPGSSLIGEKRLKQKSLSLTFLSANPDSTAYRAELNELLMWLNKTVWIVDVTNNMQIKATADTVTLGYNLGSLKQLSDNDINFTALTPYWEDLTSDSVSGTALSDTIEEIPVNNEGFLPAYPVITLVASVATDDVQIYINSDNTGIQIQDSSFGTSGNLIMVIDCATGLVSINDDDRNVSIVPGTGFFPIPIGDDTINILSNQDITYSIEWKRRVFI